MATRRPRRVYVSGTDPDPRFSLANERTFLAWVRTALALVAGAVAVQRTGCSTSSGKASVAWKIVVRRRRCAAAVRVDLAIGCWSRGGDGCETGDADAVAH